MVDARILADEAAPSLPEGDDARGEQCAATSVSRLGHACDEEKTGSSSWCEVDDTVAKPACRGLREHVGEVREGAAQGEADSRERPRWYEPPLALDVVAGVGVQQL